MMFHQVIYINYFSLVLLELFSLFSPPAHIMPYVIASVNRFAYIYLYILNFHKYSFVFRLCYPI